jgi:uncharacterized membrane protein
MLIGGLATFRVVEKLLKNHAKTLYSVIFGLLIGSSYSLLLDPIVYQSGVSVETTFVGIIMLLVGAGISFQLGKRKL